MANITLKGLLSEAEDFKAKSKETGKLVHFKSKDSYQAALKAGTHEDPKDKKGSSSKATKPNDMFGGDYAKDRGGEAPKADSMATVNSIAAKTGLRAQAVAGWADENGVNLSKVSADIDSKKLKPMDFMTAVSGNAGNKYAKDIITKYSQSGSEAPKMAGNWEPDEDGKLSSDAADDVRNYLNNVLGVDGMAEIDYNTGNIQYGLSDGENSIFVGNEDGTYNVSFEGPSMDIDKINQSYKSFKNPKEALQYAGELAKANKNGLQQKQNIDGGSTTEPQPTSKPKEARKGNPTVNKAAKKKAEEFGITTQKLGNEGYKKAMYQAAVEALTDANFHDEARELVASIEGKPEWAKRVDYPSMDDPKYKEKMADIRTNGVDSSEYWGGENATHEFARKVAASSGWDGVDAADGIAFTLRMNGFHKEADKIQSIFDNKPYMRESSTKLKSIMKK